jgi:hypothetical protein
MRIARGSPSTRSTIVSRGSQPSPTTVNRSNSAAAPITQAARKPDIISRIRSRVI